MPGAGARSGDVFSTGLFEMAKALGSTRGESAELEQKECDREARHRQWEVQREQILAELASLEGQEKVRAALAELPWKRVKGGMRDESRANVPV